MKIKKSTAIKILALALTALMLISCMQATVFATTDTGDFLNPDKIEAKDNTSGTAKKFRTAAGNILAIAQVIAVATAVIMLMVLAIKYISAAPEGKADIKKTAYIYIFGAILLFGASGILGIIKGFAGDAFGKTSTTNNN